MIDELITKTLKNYIEHHPDNYFVIGGNALNYVLEEYGIIFRATHDFDIVLVTEATDDAFIGDLKKLINDGHYINKWKNQKKTAYRFEGSAVRGYPRSIEFFIAEGQYPESLDKKLAKLDIETNEEKISAITLDKELYRFALKHRKNYDGLIFLDREALIVLKVIAYYNNLQLYSDGHKVDKEEYTKHRKDVVTILSSYNEQSLSSIGYPPDYRDQIVSFVDILAGKEVKQICSQMGLDPQVVVSYYKKLMSI